MDNGESEMGRALSLIHSPIFIFAFSVCEQPSAFVEKSPLIHTKMFNVC